MKPTPGWIANLRYWAQHGGTDDSRAACVHLLTEAGFAPTFEPVPERNPAMLADQAKQFAAFVAEERARA